MTCIDFLKDIMSVCKIETIKAIIEYLSDGYFIPLVDKSFE